MSCELFDPNRAKMQRRKSVESQRSKLVCPFRSLNLGPCRTLGLGFTPLLLCLNIFLVGVTVTSSYVSASGQEVEDTVRIKTRVVFLDALVKDKKTNLPVSNLVQENFQVLDNEKPRNVAYFTKEGQARKPLALILIMDLREDGAGRFLKRPEIIKSMESELAKLANGDEVAIMAMDFSEDEKRFWVSDFTNDRSRIAAALTRIQAICAAHQDSPDEGEPKSDKTSTTTAQDGNQTTQQPSDAVSTEVITGKNGGTITRTTRRDGRVDVKRVSKDGKATIELEGIYDMATAIKDASRKAQFDRPNSQTSVVWVSDGIAPIFFEDRDASEQALIRDNVIFNSLTVELRTLFKFLMPIGKPLAGWMGVSLYGSAKYLAQRSGGEAIKVNRTKDYGQGLAQIIGNLTARYSLGFALAEDEIDDGRMHALEVKVNTKDEKGRNRKLLVSSRQGYYMSSVAPKDAAARAQ